MSETLTPALGERQGPIQRIYPARLLPLVHCGMLTSSSQSSNGLSLGNARCVGNVAWPTEALDAPHPILGVVPAKNCLLPPFL